MPTFHLLITGKVQGVFYRASAKEKALMLGISGWIKNTKEGAVEAIITGSQENIETFIDWCKQGPRHAIVENVIVKPSEPQTFKTFSIVH